MNQAFPSDGHIPFLVCFVNLRCHQKSNFGRAAAAGPAGTEEYHGEWSSFLRHATGRRRTLCAARASNNLRGTRSMQIYLPDLPTATTSDKVVLHVTEPLELELSDPSLSKPHRKLKHILAMSLLVMWAAVSSIALVLGLILLASSAGSPASAGMHIMHVGSDILQKPTLFVASERRRQMLDRSISTPSPTEIPRLLDTLDIDL